MVAARVGISVVVPLYNKADYIERCLQSVSRQTVQPVEIIVVNDGSRDDGPALARRLLSSADTLIDQPNGGVSCARNTGMARASGEIVALIDADDEWLPNHLANIAHIAQVFPDAGLYGTGYLRFPPGLRVTVTTACSEPTLINLFRATRTGGLLTASSLAIRREALQSTGGFRPGAAIGEDVEFWNRLSVGWPLAFHPEATAIYHQARNSAVAAISGRCSGQLVTIASLGRAIIDDAIPTPLRDDIRVWIAHAMMRYTRSCIERGMLRTAQCALHHRYLQRSHLRLRAKALSVALTCLGPKVINGCYRLRGSRWLTPSVQEHDGVTVRVERRRSGEVVLTE